MLGLITSVSAQTHWESIIRHDDLWRYLPAISEPPAEWNQPGFSDTIWNTGIGGIGYGDYDDQTLRQEPVNSVYVRIKFMVDDTSVIEQVILDIDFVDAFVAYLRK